MFRQMISGCFALLVAATPAWSVIVPYTEDFSSDAADWRDGGGVNLSTWEAAGGVGGGSYVSESWDFGNNLEDDAVVLFRGHAAFNSSGSAFVGDWVGSGVDAFSMWVHHDAGVPLEMYARFATPFNFPGAVGVPFGFVPSGVWTEITIPITPTSPNIIYEGAFGLNEVFGNLGNIQVAMNVPASLAGSSTVVQFGLDQPTITPEPAAILTLGMGALAIGRRRRAH